MRIAIVGAGVSGLVAAAELAREHEIWVYEDGAYAGGHTNTVRVQTERGPVDIDTGFIVFNDRNYPEFERMIARLGVNSQPSDMSFSVADETGAFEYSATSVNGLFATRSNLVSAAFHGMLRDVLRFQREARALLASDEDPSLRAWLRDGGYGEWFVERLIVPQAAAVWSADPDQMWTFPARFLVQFFANHGMLGLRGRPRWRVISGGSARYVEALTAPFAQRIRLNAAVTSIARDDDAVTVTARGCEPERFDHVVVAAHADQALAMLADPSDREREILGAFAYQPNEAVLHTDVSLMPRRRRAWASWNAHLLDEPRRVATVTYDMNRLQSLDTPERYLVSLNMTERIDPAKVIRRIGYSHPVFTSAGMAAQARWAEISGVRRTHFCGAYWRWGFHEDGVVSGLRAARAITGGGARRPAEEALAA